MNTLRRDYEPYKKMLKQNSINEELCAYWFEVELLGFSYSQKLFNILKKEYSNIKTIQECLGELNDTKVIIGGELSELKSGTSKNKNKYIKGKINDGSGSINIMIMERDFDRNDGLNNGIKLEDGMIVMCEGRKAEDIVFCQKIVSQNVKILTKVGDLDKIKKNEN